MSDDRCCGTCLFFGGDTWGFCDERECHVAENFHCPRYARKGVNRSGIMQIIRDTDDITYCPMCGDEIKEAFADGTVKCWTCWRRFGVIEVVENDPE